jgi:hypothetical protein
MDPDFVVEVKFTIFWFHRGFRVSLDLHVPDLSNNTKKYLQVLVLFRSTYKAGI